MGPLDEFVVVLLLLLVGLGIWFGRTKDRRSTADGPELLLAAAVRRLPADRRDWGAAMTAELAQLQDPWARRRFALGCTRVALFPPRDARPLFVVGVLAVAAALVSGWSVGRAVPPLQLFAVTFTGLVGGLAALTVARSRMPRLTAAGLAITVGVAGCVAAVAYVAAIEPAGARGSLDDLSVVLALLLTGYLWVALTPSRGLVAARTTRWLGVGAGIVLGVDLAAVSMVDYDFDHAAVPYAWSAALVIVLVCSANGGCGGRIVARRRRSRTVGRAHRHARVLRGRDACGTGPVPHRGSPLPRRRRRRQGRVQSGCVRHRRGHRAPERRHCDAGAAAGGRAAARPDRRRRRQLDAAGTARRQSLNPPTFGLCVHLARGGHSRQKILEVHKRAYYFWMIHPAFTGW